MSQFHFERLEEIAREYEDNLMLSNGRYLQWQAVKLPLKATLDSIAIYLEKQPYFLQNKLTVEEINEPGNAQGFLIRCGDLKTRYGIEYGFTIGFRLTSNGKVYVFATTHFYFDLRPEELQIDYLENPSELTSERIYELVIEALEQVKSSSYLFD